MSVNIRSREIMVNIRQRGVSPVCEAWIAFNREDQAVVLDVEGHRTL